MKCLKDKKVLLCGGTNFIGPHLVRKLRGEECDITICTRGIHRLPAGNDINFITCDLNNDEQGAKKALFGLEFDIVIDCISYCPKEVFNVLSNIKTKRYIQISTMGVYCDSMINEDKELHTAITEDSFNPQTYTGWTMEVDNRTPYDTRKKFAECVAYQMFPECNPISVRPAYVADPLNPAHELNVRLPEIVDWIKHGKRINPDHKNYVACFTKAEEEADLIVKLASIDYCKPLNISSIGYIEVKDILSHISNRLNVNIWFDSNGELPNLLSGINLDVKRLKEVGFIVSDIGSWFWDYVDRYIDFPIEKYTSWKDIDQDTFNKYLNP